MPESPVGSRETASVHGDAVTGAPTRRPRFPIGSGGQNLLLTVLDEDDLAAHVDDRGLVWASDPDGTAGTAENLSAALSAVRIDR